ncbi:hypothetical protein K438DRAFT_1784465 [Mycena galopus ATCC 62051]|nr:hypothetical protein K438DRAFT_1784465 [Mycena galopus ATCC 62051]
MRLGGKQDAARSQVDTQSRTSNIRETRGSAKRQGNSEMRPAPADALYTDREWSARLGHDVVVRGEEIVMIDGIKMASKFSLLQPFMRSTRRMQKRPTSNEFGSLFSQGSGEPSTIAGKRSKLQISFSKLPRTILLPLQFGRGARYTPAPAGSFPINLKAGTQLGSTPSVRNELRPSQSFSWVIQSPVFRVLGVTNLQSLEWGCDEHLISQCLSKTRSYILIVVLLDLQLTASAYIHIRRPRQSISGRSARCTPASTIAYT